MDTRSRSITQNEPLIDNILEYDIRGDDISEYDYSENEIEEDQTEEDDQEEGDEWAENITRRVLDALHLVHWVLLMLLGYILTHPERPGFHLVSVLVALVEGAFMNCLTIGLVFGKAGCTYIPTHLLLWGFVVVVNFYYPILLPLWVTAHCGLYLYYHRDLAMWARMESANIWTETQLVKMGYIAASWRELLSPLQFDTTGTRDWLRARSSHFQQWRQNLQNPLPFRHFVLRAQQVDDIGSRGFNHSDAGIIERNAESRKATAKEDFAYIHSHEKLVEKHADLEYEYKNLEERSFWLVQALGAASISSKVREREHAEQLRDLDKQREEREQLIKVYEKRLKAMK